MPSYYVPPSTNNPEKTPAYNEYDGQNRTVKSESERGRHGKIVQVLQD